MTSDGGNRGRAGAAGELEVSQDMRLTERGWRIERIGWAAMALLVGAGLLGLFGNGPLSWREAGERGGTLHLEFERFIRHEAPVVLRLSIGLEAADADGRIRLWIGHRYLEALKLEQVTPEPEWVETGPDRTTLVLRAAQRDGPSKVVARLEAETIGSIRGEVGVESPRGAAPAAATGAAAGARLEFSQFAYP